MVKSRTFGNPNDIPNGPNGAALMQKAPKQNACGGSFATAPGCSSDPKNKNLLQKIICQGQANPTDSITFALLTAATVSSVVLQTDKWIKCGKPSKGALYAFGALGLWGVEVARSLNNIHVDEKNLGGKEKPILGGLGSWETLGWQEKVEFVLKGTGCRQNGLTITGYNGKTYTLRTPTDEEQNKINEAPTPAAVSILLIPLVVPLGLNIYWNGDKAELIDADTEQSINICTGASTAGGGGDGPG